MARVKETSQSGAARLYSKVKKKNSAIIVCHTPVTFYRYPHSIRRRGSGLLIHWPPAPPASPGVVARRTTRDTLTLLQYPNGSLSAGSCGAPPPPPGVLVTHAAALVTLIMQGGVPARAAGRQISARAAAPQ